MGPIGDELGNPRNLAGYMGKSGGYRRKPAWDPSRPGRFYLGLFNSDWGAALGNHGESGGHHRKTRGLDQKALC